MAIASNRPISICLINQKGGCGKSSTCFHLAGAFAASGKRVLLVDVDPQGSISQAFFLIENLLRVDLKPVEEAESFQKLMTVNNWNGKQLASALNISPTRISRALALLKLPHETRVRIDKGEISPRAGYELSRLPTPELKSVTQSHSSVTIKQASQPRQRRPQTRPPRGVRQTFLAENGWRIVATSRRKGTYHDIEQALTEALEEVRLRIDNRIKLI